MACICGLLIGILLFSLGSYAIIYSTQRRERLSLKRWYSGAGATMIVGTCLILLWIGIF